VRCGVRWYSILCVNCYITLQWNISELQSYYIYFIIISVPNIISVTICELTVLYYGQSRENIFGLRMHIFSHAATCSSKTNVQMCTVTRASH